LLKDVAFYFSLSLLIAAFLCYAVFIIKTNMQAKEIADLDAALETVGTMQQKEYEKEVLDYQNKINDFSTLFLNHEFASNVFAFVEKETLPKVWFGRFVLNQKDSTVQLSGEADDMDTFSRQVAEFEKNEYVKSITLLNSNLGESANVGFNISITLYPKIFKFIENQNAI